MSPYVLMCVCPSVEKANTPVFRKTAIPLEAVKVYTTLGEVIDELRTVYGEWREPPVYW